MGNVTAFRQQYGDLHDAGIRSICYEYGGEETNWQRNITLLIVCFNHSSKSLEEDSWEYLKLTLVGIQAFRFDEPHNTTNQISYAVAILFDGKEYFFDFDFDSGTGEDTTIEEISKSRFFIRCRDFSYEVVNAF